MDRPMNVCVGWKPAQGVVQPEAYISHVDKLVDEHGELVSDGTRKFLREYMQAFANWVETIRS
jgi:chromate reductase, NAD(P)H dehydrogenase (quinone)